ncbi:MAG: hypothetical protein HW416_2969 [Chloroflexi bacterium]|nr:hypothetical protein [Chloroflexota bacterium]
MITPSVSADEATSSEPRSPFHRRHRALVASIGAVGLALAVVTVSLVLLVSVVRIESDPPGGVVFIDDQPVGQTPVLRFAAGRGTWQVRVEAPGHTTWSGRIAYAPPGLAQAMAKLAPMPGSLQIQTDPDNAEVRIDDRVVGVSPVAIGNIEPGLRQITLVAQDFEPWTGAIRITPGGAFAQRIALRPIPARLRIDSPARDASFWVDGSMRGTLPVEVSVEAGERLLRIEAPGFRAWEMRSMILPNEVRALSIPLLRPWPAIEDGERVHPLAVIIENQDDARPQTGLDRADIVYEALAEGGITRFLALYATREADIIGPVRSARHYFVNWAQEYQAPLVHVGASPQGFAALRSAGLPDVEETLGGPIWRSGSRPAPHNAYTSTIGIQTSLGARGANLGSFGGLQFKTPTGAARHSGRSTSDVAIKFGRGSYVVEWSYDPVTNEYSRSMNGRPHDDAMTGEPIQAANVFIQWTDSWLIPGDENGRLDFAQVGGGKLLALVDGIAIEGTWRKRSLGTPTAYLDHEGNPILINPGPTWIQVVPPAGRVDFPPS